ncbi:propanediol dehydratase small subunit [Geodermatophilus pulveris]|uniref:Propanediol dehydratase small subunit n=1 Tax=Geodermatophilus pulveris TaxID=1564159 RepID=A0A239IY48_9ACTN|nr:diol dehydratase small subunit [Geodermatophilus pulveris]SNS98312.1 propanediol dehydratase small subunit [Geodermatophilus pulveris]
MTSASPPTLNAADYPLSINRPELLRTPTGKPITALTMDSVVSGDLSPADLRIAPETLQLQAQLAEASGRPQLAANFRRAAEMTAIPDQEVLAMYNALRPRASTAEQLAALAERLEGTYTAPVCAALVREAAEVYARRGLLARPEAGGDADAGAPAGSPAATPVTTAATAAAARADREEGQPA